VFRLLNTFQFKNIGVFPMKKSMQKSLLLAALPLVMLAGCATQAPMFSQEGMPAPVLVPEGNVVAMETVGVGQITYECQAKKTNDGFAWTFVGPDAKLNNRAGTQVGKYYGPPATWEMSDGSKVTGAQVAVSPAAAGNIPLQLVKANPAIGSGSAVGVTYIQRVATKNGVAPSTACGAAEMGKKEIVYYQADYIFYKAK
jgi:hypothetical protein